MPDEGRQKLVDSWPMDVDISRASSDWGYSPQWGLDEALDEYIVPSIRRHYENVS